MSASKGLAIGAAFTVMLLVWLVLAAMFSGGPKSPSSTSGEADRGRRREGHIALTQIASTEGNHYRLIIESYGQPERDASTENDSPRPPIVTRIIEYRPENVKIAFVPNAKFGEAPPYMSWKLIGCIDITTNKKLSYSEAAGRLQGRMR